MLTEDKYIRYGRYLLIICGVGILIKLVTINWGIMVYKFPLELRENAIVITTRLLEQGRNPYVSDLMPANLNVYGMFYNFWLLPAVKIWGVTYQVHRFFSELFLGLSALLMYVVLRREGAVKGLAFSGAVLYYVQYFTRILDMTARPDSLGVLLFILSVFIPKRYKYSNLSLIFSMGLSILAFVTKIYFALGFGYILIWLWWKREFRKAMVFSVVYIVILIMIALTLNRYMDSYLYNVFLVNSGSKLASWGHLIFQIKYFGYWNFGLLLALAVIATKNVKILQKNGLAWVGFWVSTFLVLVKLGWSTGNYLTYFVHLISPFLIWLVVGGIRFLRGDWKKIAVICLVVNTMWFGYKLMKTTPMVLDNGDWSRLEKTISDHKEIYNSPLGALMISNLERRVYDSGQAEFYKDGLGLNRKLNLLPGAEGRYEKFVNEVRNKVEKKEFDLILDDGNNLAYFDREWLAKYYDVGDSFQLSVGWGYWTTMAWLPK